MTAARGTGVVEKIKHLRGGEVAKTDYSDERAKRASDEASGVGENLYVCRIPGHPGSLAKIRCNVLLRSALGRQKRATNTRPGQANGRGAPSDSSPRNLQDRSGTLLVQM